MDDRLHLSHQTEGEAVQGRNRPLTGKNGIHYARRVCVDGIGGMDEMLITSVVDSLCCCSV